MDNSVENYMIHGQRIALFYKKENVLDLSDVIVQIESDMQINQ